MFNSEAEKKDAITALVEMARFARDCAEASVQSIPNHYDQIFGIVFEHLLETQRVGLLMELRQQAASQIVKAR